MRRIAFANQKGGVGKTSCVLNVGVGLALRRKKVLAIDLDPQAHLTFALAVDAEHTVDDLLAGRLSLADVTLRDVRPGLALVPSSVELAGREHEFKNLDTLKDALAGVRGYDYLLVDTPPSLSLLTLNALSAVHSVYVPLQMEVLALAGLSRLIETVNLVREYNRHLKIAGVIPCRFDQRKRLNKDVLRRLKELFGQAVFRTAIRENISIAESPSYGKDIFDYKPRSHGAEDYAALCREILRREKL